MINFVTASFSISDNEFRVEAIIHVFLISASLPKNKLFSQLVNAGDYSVDNDVDADVTRGWMR